MALAGNCSTFQHQGGCISWSPTSSDRCRPSKVPAFGHFVRFGHLRKLLYAQSQCTSGARRNCALSERASELGRDPQLESSPKWSQSSRIFVGNLPWTCDSQELAKVLLEIGIVDVEEVEVICDRDTGKSRGFGYVTLATIGVAQAAIKKIDGYVFQSRPLKAGFSHPFRRAARQQKEEYAAEASKIFVGNLPWGVDDGSLEEFFRSHGKVLEAKVIYDRDTGRSRGFGFVTLSAPHEANDAVKSLDGAECDGRLLRVRLAGDEDDNRPQLTQQA